MPRMRRELVAPCGMNCNLCSWVLDPAKPGCAGCRPACGFARVGGSVPDYFSSSGILNSSSPGLTLNLIFL